MSDDLIAALERLVEAWDAEMHYELSEADTQLLRAHIADLKAGGICDAEPEDEADATVNSPRLNVMYDDGPAERAKVVSWLRGDEAAAVFNTHPGCMKDGANAIASGAHMETNNG